MLSLFLKLADSPKILCSFVLKVSLTIEIQALHKIPHARTVTKNNMAHSLESVFTDSAACFFNYLLAPQLPLTDACSDLGVDIGSPTQKPWTQAEGRGLW